jgi:hypothetical protein
MIIHSYEYIYVYATLINTSKRLSQFDLKIHEVSYQERLAVDEDVPLKK